MSTLAVAGTTSEIDSAIERAFAENRIVGAVVLVAQNGEIVDRKSVV